MAEITVVDHVINVPNDHPDVSVSMVLTTPSAGEIKDKKDMFKVAVSSITVSTVEILGDQSVLLSQDPFHEFPLKAYALVNFAIFALGMALLLLSLLFPQVPPAAVGLGQKLTWIAVALIYIAHGLKITIHAIY